MRPVKAFVPRFDVHELMIRLKTLGWEAKRDRRRLGVGSPSYDKAFWNGWAECSAAAMKEVQKYVGEPAYNKQARRRK